MRDNQPTNSEDRATQPMEAGGWVSQFVKELRTGKKMNSVQLCQYLNFNLTLFFSFDCESDLSFLYFSYLVFLLPTFIQGPCFSLRAPCGSRSSSCVSQFLSDPGIPGVRSMGPSVSNWVRDVVETIQVIDSMQVIQVIQVIESIQRRWPFLVAPSGGQICN